MIIMDGVNLFDEIKKIQEEIKKVDLIYEDIQLMTDKLEKVKYHIDRIINEFNNNFERIADRITKIEIAVFGHSED